MSISIKTENGIVKVANVGGSEAEAKISKYEQNGFLSENLINPSMATKTTNGVTCTNNGNGTYTVNGTATANTFFDLLPSSEFPSLEVGKTYKLFGCPSGGSENGYQLKARNAGGTYDTGNGYSFVASSSVSDYVVVIRIGNGTACDNLTFKPMLTTELNSTYNDYMPYAPSNVDLMKKINEIINALG